MISGTIRLYKDAYSGLTRNIWLLSLVMLINRSGTMVLAYLTLYNREMGFSLQQGGWLVAIYGLGAFAGGFLGGKLSDVFGFSRVQFLALFAGGLLFILLGQMKTYTGMCVVTFILSMVNESFRPANASAIAHYSNAGNRTKSFSLVRLAINMGWGVGSALGGFLASIDYHLLFWVDGITNIAAALLLYVILPREKEGQHLQKEKLSAADAKSQSLYRSPAYMFFLFCLLLFATCFFQLFTTVPVFFKTKLGLSEYLIGIVMSINGVVIALFEMVLVHRMEGRKSYLSYMSFGTVLMALAFLVLNIPLASGFLVALAAVAIITLAEMTSMPFMNSYYISKSTDATRGQYAGLYTMAWSAAQVIGSSAGAAIAGAVGFVRLWWIVGLLAGIAALGFNFLRLKTKTN